MNQRIIAIFLFIFILSLSSCAPKQSVKQGVQTVSQQPDEDSALPDITAKAQIWEDPVPENAEEAVTVQKKPEQYLMLNFENADIQTVISTIGEMLKINYILEPGISGKITIQSNEKIPLSELFSTFQTILELNGFTAVKDGGFYRVVHIDTARQQPVPVVTGKTAVIPDDLSFVMQEIPLEYVKAGDIANIVRNLMPRGTDIVTYEPSNMLIVTAPPAGIIKLIKLLEAIDIPAAEKDITRTFVYSVENGEAKKLASILKKLYADKPASRNSAVKSFVPNRTQTRKQSTTRRPLPAKRVPAKGATVLTGLPGEIEGDVVIEAYEDINALIVKTTPRGYISLLETIKKLDIQPKQVLIEVLIAEVTLNDSTELGIEWLLKKNVNFRSGGSDYDLIGGYSTGNLKYSTTDGLIVDSTDSILSYPSGLFANIFNPVKFNMIISAAAATNNLNVIASPHILALNNKEARIEIADEVPVATSISQAQSSNDYTTSQVQFKSAGTILTVTPHINAKNQVTLKISQEVSELGAVVPIAGQDFQGFRTRKANTTAIVQDGHTLVIGGIINERKERVRSGIPFLSKIPVLGYLFGSTADKNERRELLLMVTPHVVSSAEEADALTKEFKSRVKDLQDKLERREKNYN